MPQMTIDEILAGAKSFLAKDHVADDARRKAAGGRGGTSQTEKDLREQSRKMPAIRNALDVAAIPASLIPNPLAPVAGGYLALRGIQSAVEDPSAMSAGMAAVGAVPYVRQARTAAGGAAKVAKKVVGEVDRYMPNIPGFKGPSKAAEIPKPGGVPYQRPTAYNPADAHMPNTPSANSNTFGEAAERVMGSVDRHMPNSPAPMANRYGEAANPVQSSVRIGADQYHPSLNALDDMVRQTVTEPMPGPFANKVDDVMRGGADDVPNNPVARRAEAERRTGRELTDEEVEQVLMEQADNFDNGAVPAHLKALDDIHAERMGSGAHRTPYTVPEAPATASKLRRGERPPDDYVHPATNESQFGFDEVLEISERELAAMQKRWARYGAR